LVFQFSRLSEQVTRTYAGRALQCCPAFIFRYALDYLRYRQGALNMGFFIVLYFKLNNWCIATEQSGLL